MKKLIALTLILMSVSAFARETVSITHFGNSGRNQSYYACSYAESQAESFLVAFGAKNIEVSCSGGIQPWGMAQAVSLWASFDLPVVTTQTVETLAIEGDWSSPSCGLNVQIINAFLKVFPNISVVKKSDSCAFHNSNYSYLLNITR